MTIRQTGCYPAGCALSLLRLDVRLHELTESRCHVRPERRPARPSPEGADDLQAAWPLQRLQMRSPKPALSKACRHIMQVRWARASPRARIGRWSARSGMLILGLRRVRSGGEMPRVLARWAGGEQPGVAGCRGKRLTGGRNRHQTFHGRFDLGKSGLTRAVASRPFTFQPVTGLFCGGNILGGAVTQGETKGLTPIDFKQNSMLS